MTPCSQQCHNTDGSYYCSCIDGFVADGPNCVNSSGELLIVISPLPYMYVTQSITLPFVTLFFTLLLYHVFHYMCHCYPTMYVIITLPFVTLCFTLLLYHVFHYMCHCYPTMYVTITLPFVTLCFTLLPYHVFHYICVTRDGMMHDLHISIYCFLNITIW